jgi:hypothetical protein
MSRAGTMRQIAAIGLVVASAMCVQAARAHAASKKLAGYDLIVVKAFTIDKGPATSSAPPGLESMIHARAVQELQAKAIFDGVIDAAPPATDTAEPSDQRVDMRISAAQPIVTGPPGAETHLSGRADRRVALSGTILSFSKGNRATRYLTDGMGGGKSKLTMRFTLTDAKTGDELMSWTDTGTFKGTLSPFGGSANQAMAGAANGVVKELIKQIEKNR